MFDEAARTRLAPLLTPLARRLVRVGLTANMTSVLAFALACLAAWLVAAGSPVAGILVWIVSRIGDGLDGIVAREAGAPGPFGGYLDITLDMGAYSLMALGFAVAHPDLGIVWPAMLGAYVLAITTTLALSNAATAAGRRVSHTNRTFQFTAGLAEAGETSAAYVSWVLFPSWMPWLTWAWVAIVVLTVVQRSWLAWRVLR